MKYSTQDLLRIEKKCGQKRIKHFNISSNFQVIFNLKTYQRWPHTRKLKKNKKIINLKKMKEIYLLFLAPRTFLH